MNELLRRLNIDHPIIQAPMGGGSSTPALAAAVARAGGLGSIAGGYLTPQQIIDETRQTRALTDRPLAINLFAGGRENRVADPKPMLELLGEVHERLGIAAPILPPIPPDAFDDQFAAVLEAKPGIFSFTFGIPDSDKLARLKASGIVTMGTATTLEEARRLADAGIDAVVAQGAEAGAHRGTFLGAFDFAMVPTLDLVRQIAEAARVPIVASGGLMAGHEIAAALAAGASAVQLGTAFLPCPESGAPAAHKQAILAQRDDRTVITRAFSGRPARGIANGFIAHLAGREEAILPYPLQNALTRAMRAAAAQQGSADYLSLWAGSGAARARALPAADLVSALLGEMTRA